MRYRILGDDIQLVEVALEPGEQVYAETGAMAYMDGQIRMNTTTGGLIKGLKRLLVGESFFMTEFTNPGPEPAVVAFASPFPGKIVALKLAEVGGTFLSQRTSFLAATRDVDISIAFTRRLGAGLFGGEGFILQKLTGHGLVFLTAGGTLIGKELGPGQELLVDTGCIVGFSATVDYNIRFVGGFKNMLFGGEGLFLARLRGPGHVLLQSLPLSRLADRILAAARHLQGETRRGSGFWQTLLSGT
ncbi:MAG: TIGR00266 family protein [Chloroflexi bacterium]|nr:TIGR00266 family protein [Chloroflexota bacterium]